MEPAGIKVSTPIFPFPRSHNLENPSTKVVGIIELPLLDCITRTSVSSFLRLVVQAGVCKECAAQNQQAPGVYMRCISFVKPMHPYKSVATRLWAMVANPSLHNSPTSAASWLATRLGKVLMSLAVKVLTMPSFLIE